MHYFMQSAQQNSLELRTRHSQIASPAIQTHDCILIDSLTLATDWHEIAVFVWTEEDVFGVQEPHMISGCCGTNATIQNHIGLSAAAIEFQACETSASITTTIRG